MPKADKPIKHDGQESTRILIGDVMQASENQITSGGNYEIRH
jgi:hypothetical protein